MRKYVRDQTDDKYELYSRSTAIECPRSEQRTRQEDAKDLDINTILNRHGAAGLIRRQQINGEVNYDMDRFQALAAIADARRFHQRLPEDLKTQYPKWTDVLAAIDDGSLKTVLEERNARIKAETEAAKTPPIPPQ